MQGGQNGQVPDLVCFQADSAQINTSLAAYKVHEKKQKHKKLLLPTVRRLSSSSAVVPATHSNHASTNSRSEYGQSEVTLTCSPHREVSLDFPYCAVDELENSQKTNAFWVRRKAEISEGLLMHERHSKSEASSEPVPFSPHPWSKLKLPYKSTHDVCMLPKIPRNKPEACGTHL